MNSVSPVTKAARQAQIADILARSRVRSQEELAELLAKRGVRVAQATLSRDLDELGAVRLRGSGGGLVYALPGEPGGPGSRPGGVVPGEGHGTSWRGTPVGARGGLGPRGLGGHTRRFAEAGPPAADQPDRLARMAVDLLVSAEASANLVVLRTPAGGAQLLASAIDHAGWASILGTVAGDDTVLVITRDPTGGDLVAAELLRLAERRT